MEMKCNGLIVVKVDVYGQFIRMARCALGIKIFARDVFSLQEQMETLRYNLY
jgi:hypothetical protein